MGFKGPSDFEAVFFLQKSSLNNIYICIVFFSQCHTRIVICKDIFDVIISFPNDSIQMIQLSDND
jgi:hypothetical protein